MLILENSRFQSFLNFLNNWLVAKHSKICTLFAQKIARFDSKQTIFLKKIVHSTNLIAENSNFPRNFGFSF